VDNTSLGGVVGRLHLGEVDNVPTHRTSSNKATVGEVGELLAIDISAFLLLTAPVDRSSLGAVKDAVKVNADDRTVVLNRAVDHRALGPGYTSVGNEDIETAVEILDNGVGGVLDGLEVGRLDLVGLGCNARQLAMSTGRQCSGRTYLEHRTSWQSRRHAQ